jgi:hypothetical protein
MTATPGQNDKPFGLKEIIIENMAGTVRVSLPAALELGFEEMIVTGEFYGNDDLQGVVTQPIGLKGTFKQGGYPLSALSLMTGHDYALTGTTPNQVATLQGDSATYPYFKIYGKSLGDEGDDIHVKIFKAKLTAAPKGTFKRAEFFMLETEFTGVKVSGKAYDVVANETATTLPALPDTPDVLSVITVPADAATDVVITANLTATFNNELASGAESGIILTTAAGVPVAVARTIDAARKVVTLNPTASLGAATDYLLIVAGVTDVFGQTLTDTVVDFTTAA